MRHWQIEVALCEDGCQKNNEAVNKAFHSFSPWLWLGSLLWQKRNLLIFHVWHFACSVSRLDHRRGSRGGGGGGRVGFTQRSGCFCKVSKRLWKLCNRYNMQHVWLDIWPTSGAVLQGLIQILRIWGCGFAWKEVLFLSYWLAFAYHNTCTSIIASYVFRTRSWREETVTQYCKSTGNYSCYVVTVYQISPGAGRISTCSVCCTFGWGSGSVEIWK